MPRSLDLLVRPLTLEDCGWVRATMVRNWTSTTVVRRGELVEATALPGFVAMLGGRRAGLVLVDIRDRDFEVVAISSSRRRQGVGRALMEQCVEQARGRGCRRLWLVTTNDNIVAIAFYQRFGMDLCAFYKHGIRAARELKPSIPLLDSAGVPIEHELEFELLLDA